MWTTFAAATGGASAGLTGLMFIVVAFRFDTIAVSQEYRSRAAQSLALLVATMITSLLVNVPQSPRALGVEMLVVAVSSAAVLTRLDATAVQEQTRRRNPALAIALLVFTSCIAASGVGLLLNQGDGLYFYAASAVTGLVWAVYGAWIFLTRAGVSANGTASDA